QAADLVLAVGVRDELNIELALAVRLMPLLRRFWADEAHVDGVESQKTVALRHALEQKLIPRLRTGISLADHGEAFRVPVGDQEIRLFQVEDVHQLVAEDAGPVEGPADALAAR